MRDEEGEAFEPANYCAKSPSTPPATTNPPAKTATPDGVNNKTPNRMRVQGDSDLLRHHIVSEGGLNRLTRKFCAPGSAGMDRPAPATRRFVDSERYRLRTVGGGPCATVVHR
jgi:hypothetical protein